MGAWPVVRPQVKPVMSTGFCRVCRLWWRAVGGLDDGEGEFLEFGEQGAEFFGVVEQGLPGGELFGGEPAGDGFAADFAGPFGVGAVPGGGAGVAAAAGLAAFVGAHEQGARQGGAGRGGELGGDPVQGLLLPGGWVHATHRLRSMALAGVHSIFLWTVPPRWEAPWPSRPPWSPATSHAGARLRSPRPPPRSPATWWRRRARPGGTGPKACCGRRRGWRTGRLGPGWTRRRGCCCTRR